MSLPIESIDQQDPFQTHLLCKIFDLNSEKDIKRFIGKNNSRRYKWLLNWCSIKLNRLVHFIFHRGKLVHSKAIVDVAKHYGSFVNKEIANLQAKDPKFETDQAQVLKNKVKLFVNLFEGTMLEKTIKETIPCIPEKPINQPISSDEQIHESDKVEITPDLGNMTTGVVVNSEGQIHSNDTSNEPPELRNNSTMLSGNTMNLNLPLDTNPLQDQKLPIAETPPNSHESPDASIDTLINIPLSATHTPLSITGHSTHLASDPKSNTHQNAHPPQPESKPNVVIKPQASKDSTSAQKNNPIQLPRNTRPSPITQPIPPQMQAARDLVKKANQANVDAMIELGFRLELGIGLNQNISEAIAYFEKAANLDSLEAIFHLAFFFHYNIKGGRDHERANSWQKKAQEKLKSIEPQLRKDKWKNRNTITCQWYEKAVHQGQTHYSIILAIMYLNGLGIKQDMIKTIEHYTLLANAGDASYCRRLGCLLAWIPLNWDYAKAIEWLNKAIEKKDSLAFFHLGFMHELGLGIIQNIELAWKLYEQGAAKSEICSTMRLLDLYQNGSIPHNSARIKELTHQALKIVNENDQTDVDKTIFAESTPWYEKAAENNDLKLALRAARIHLDGMTGIKDLQKGVKMLCIACNGDPEIMIEIGDVYTELKDDENAKKWYLEAEKCYLQTEKTNSEAPICLGDIYAKLDNFIQAEAYYNQAVIAKHPQAKIKLGDLFVQLSRFEQAHQYYLSALSDGALEALDSIYDLGIVFEELAQKNRKSNHQISNTYYMKALEIFFIGVESGHILAINKVGSIYASKAIALSRKSDPKWTDYQKTAFDMYTLLNPDTSIKNLSLEKISDYFSQSL
jgi:TPR repeat protein